jgi:hypothetical protein
MTLKIGPVNTGSIASLGSFTDMTVQQLSLMLPQLQAYTADGSADALPLHVSGTVIVESTGVNAMTLGAPTVGNQAAGGDSGRVLIIISNGAFAHTITATGLLKTGSAAVNVATFAAFAGASLTLRASAGLWYVISSNAVTFT